jgi:hypothetical protein
MEAGLDASMGTVGDALDNALMESTIGLYKTELIKKERPWKNLADVELATASRSARGLRLTAAPSQTARSACVQHDGGRCGFASSPDSGTTHMQGPCWLLNVLDPVNDIERPLHQRLRQRKGRRRLPS